MAEKMVDIVKPVDEGAAQPAPAPASNGAGSSVNKPAAAETTAQGAAKGAGAAALMESGEKSTSVRPDVRPHVFVVMPFGKKTGANGLPYDFNAIYETLIKPALKDAGFEPFRADEETQSGDILTDMFQELLLADLVLADLSIDNANAFYELGIRHAFRRRGVMHIQAGRAYMPFDIFNVRTLPYHLTEDGVPHPDFIRADITAIARMAKDTWRSDRDAVHSPVFNLLSGLKEPDRKMLSTPLAKGFWREYNDWKERITVAQRQKRIGDILLLTEEIQNPLIKEEALGEAGKALKNMGLDELALVQYRRGLEVNRSNMIFRREEAFHLNRLGRGDEAIIKLEGLLSDYPNDSETLAYLGRIYKEMWVNSWKDIKERTRRTKAAFESYHWLIRSIDMYLNGYRIDLNNYYPGINALTLSTIAVFLADLFDDKKDPDPDINRIRAGLDELRGALSFALESRADDVKADYWTLVSLAELRVLTSTTQSGVERAYRKALPAARRNLSSLQSSIDQLKILAALGMRQEYVQIAMETLIEEIQRTDKDAVLASRSRTKQPSGQVFLFAGYMVDHPGKEQQTFPARREEQIYNEIKRRLTKLNAGPEDVAYVAGLSAGSEIIFAEICAEMNIPVKAYLPLPEAAYVRDFISPGGNTWVERFYRVRNHRLVDENYQPERLGDPKAGVDPYERNNRWALYSSLARGVDKVRLLALWDAKSATSRDRDAHLVKHMIELMRDTGGAIELIDSAKYLHDPGDTTAQNPQHLSKPAATTVTKSKKDSISEQRRKKM